MNELASYKSAYQGLKQYIEAGNDKGLKQLANELEEIAERNAQHVPKEDNRLTAGEFSKMNYYERLTLKQENPDEYERLAR